jgi:hypothetical protein
MPKPFRFSSTDLSHEAQLLLCCARTQVDAANAERIIALLQEKIDWDFLLQMAFNHKLAPLLYRHLEAVCPREIPESARTELREQIRVDIEGNLFLTKELLHLLALFGKHGIQVIPYKGPVLALSVYGDLALRPSSDLDILVHEGDILQATDLLTSCGYQIIRPFNVAQTEKSLQLLYVHQLVQKAPWAYQLVLSHSTRQVLVELHWRVTPKHVFPLNPQQLWENLQPVPVVGVTVPSFAPEQLLWFLCVHGAKHQWGQLNWICDVAELIRAHPDLNWEQIVVQAKKLGVERRLYLGLLLAHCLLETPLPRLIKTKLDNMPQVGVLAQRVIERVFDYREPTAGSLGLDSLVFPLKAMDHMADRGRYLLHLAAPATRDRAIVRLPSSFSLLYYLIKPIRLARRYILRLTKQVR